MNFASDTSAPAHPKILEAMQLANCGPATSYGADGWSIRAEAALSDFFEAPIRACFVSSGTAANALAISLLCPAHGGVICHQHSHLYCDERGAPEFFTGGAKLLTVGGVHAKPAMQEVTAILEARDESFVHSVPAKALSFSNLSECGVSVTPSQIAMLSTICARHDVKVHMDGARAANALAFLKVRPADISWASGINAMSLGFGKNGAMGAECVVLFADTAQQFDELEIRRKRSGHMVAKQRFIAAQVLAMLEGELWLQLANRANDCARQLAAGMQNEQIALVHPVEGNEVFVMLSANQISKLRDAGAGFYAWPDGSCRFVCSWDTQDKEVEQLLGLLT